MPRGAFKASHNDPQIRAAADHQAQKTTRQQPTPPPARHTATPTAPPTPPTLPTRPTRVSAAKARPATAPAPATGSSKKAADESGSSEEANWAAIHHLGRADDEYVERR